MLHRGESIIEGDKVTMNVKEDHARVSKPRGRMDLDGAKKAITVPAPPAPSGPLPASCPVPPLAR